jgi:hypothetical protein
LKIIDDYRLVRVLLQERPALVMMPKSVDTFGRVFVKVQIRRGKIPSRLGIENSIADLVLSHSNKY